MRKTWLTDVIGTEKAAIGLVHLKALPGDPLYDAEGGMNKVYEMAVDDIHALQEGGIDALQFSNEFSFPYQQNPSKEIVSAMAFLMGKLQPEIRCKCDQQSDRQYRTLRYHRGAVDERHIFRCLFGQSRSGECVDR